MQEATIKQLNDELRDTENELIMARAKPPPFNEEDKKEIQQL